MQDTLSKQITATLTTSKTDYVPMKILEVEISHSLPKLSAIDEKTGRHYLRAKCLVRLHAQPLGTVELDFAEDELKADAYAPIIWRALNRQINEHLHQDGLPEVVGLDEMGVTSCCTPLCVQERDSFAAHAPFVSVIIATCDRTESLKTCLSSLLALNYEHYEIIVVDNAPSTSDTADLIRQMYRDIPHIHYVCENRRGLSWARNRGILTAKGEILAFTDDDMIVDSNWLLELVRDFSLSDDVACVTGMILPMQLETPAQFWFEEYGGYSKGYSRRIFDMRENHPKTPLYPYETGRFGSGGSMAFTAAFLHNVGGFDCALGVGSPAKGAEDIAAFFQVIKAGYKVVYEPKAIAYHRHYRDYADLRKQVYNYGIGLTVYLIKILFENPFLLFDFLAKVPYGLFLIMGHRSPKNNKKSLHYPKELTKLELKGMLYGPFAYLHSRWALRRYTQDKEQCLDRARGL